MHRNNRYTKNVQPAKTQQRRVWKPHSSNKSNKTIGTTNRGKLYSRNNNNSNSANNKSDTRRFITRKSTAPSHEHRHGDEFVNDGYNNEVGRYYEDNYEYEDDYIYDENTGFENEYYDEDIDVYNNNNNDDVIYIKENFGDERDSRYGDKDRCYDEIGGRYGEIGGCYGKRGSRYRDGDGYHNDDDNNNSNYNRNDRGSYGNNIHEEYEREFFSNNIRKRSRNLLDAADVVGQRDVRSRLGPRSPVEHEEDNLDVDVGYDDSYMDDPQVVFNHPSSSRNSTTRNRLDSSENYRYDVVDDEIRLADHESCPVDHEAEFIEDHGGAYTTAPNQDKQTTRALLDEFGVSITDIADYLRRQVAEKENNGNLTLNQLLEEKFLNGKSATADATHADIETTSLSSRKEKKRSISPKITVDSASKSGPLKRDEGKRKSESSTRRAESNTVKHSSHKDKNCTSSPHSDRSAKSHSTKDRRSTRPSEKNYGKRSRSPDGKYHTVRLKDGEKKSSYSPDRKSHRTRQSSSERESSELKRRWSYDDRRMNKMNAKKTSSIEAFLINAGNQGVNEFKKQQASQFIASKLQTAHFQTLKPAIVFPVAPLVIPQHHVVVAAPPPPITKPIMSPVFIPINAPSATSDFLPLDTKNDMPKKQNIPATERDTKKKQTDTKISKASATSSINETLSLLRKSSGSATPQEACDINKSVNIDSDQETNEDADNNGTNKDENYSSSDDEVSITRVVEPKTKKKTKKTLIQPVVAPTQTNANPPTKSNNASITTGSNRKVFLEDKSNKMKASEVNSTSVTNNNNKETSPRTRVRVPSWFNTRLVELFKKRHKKVQQLKRAKQDSSGVANNPNRVKELQESLRDIDREYIPLCHKTKEEFIKNGGTSSSSSRTKQEIAVLGFDESILDVDVPALF